MTANSLNQTKYDAVAANTVNGAVLDAAAILAWRQDVKAVVDQHAQEVNAHLADSTHIGKNPSCRVYNTTNISIPNNATTPLPFNAQRRNQGNMHNTGVNNTRITIPVDGVYLIGGTVSFAANATGTRVLNIRLNGSINISANIKQAISGSTIQIVNNTIYSLSAGDYLELIVIQLSGAALDVVAAGNYSPEFYAVRVG